MNRTLKFVLIAVVLIGIITTIVYFIQVPGDGVKERIASTPFEKEIENKVQIGIVGQNYDAASTAFYNILDTIATEASIVIQGGSKQLTKDEVKNCKEYAFNAYLLIVDQYQKEYFGRSSWTEQELNALKSRAQALLDMKIAKGDDESMLASIVKNVNDYYAAWKVINGAKTCSTIAGAKNISEQVGHYERPPLTNNASLQAGLSEAFDDAKTSVAKIIASIQDIQHRKELIDRYKEEFGEDAIYDDLLASLDYDISPSTMTVVVVDGVNVRLRRSPAINNSNIISEPLHPNNGEYLPYLGMTYDFYKVRYKGYDAYISKRFSHLVNGYVVVDGVNVRLRRTPAINNTNIIIEPIHPANGEFLEYLGETSDFYKVRFKGYDAYISKQFSHTINR